jgi:hypothetical protein
MSEKQIRYERLLDYVEKKEGENFERDLKNEILPGIVNFINTEIKTLEHENVGKSLEKMRDSYKRIIKKDISYLRKHELLNDLIFHINGWVRRTNKKLSIKVIMNPKYYGKAEYIDKYELIIENKEFKNDTKLG